MNNPSKQPEDNRSVGDENVDRLLANSYQPESLDPEFVTRIHDLAREQVAGQGERSTGERNAGGGAGVPGFVSAGSLWWVATAAALFVCVSSALYLLSDRDDPGFYKDGLIVWINGRPYAPVESEDEQAEGSVVRPVPGGSVPEPTLVGFKGLNARPRAKRPDAAVTKVGTNIVTKRGERRIITLEDGSWVYLNEDTDIQIATKRRVVVSKGEVFVDVSPAKTKGDRFVVALPGRELTAFGTKFAVKVDKADANVAVTQGRVLVSDVDTYVKAGQRILLNGLGEEKAFKLTRLQRASHVLSWTRELIEAIDSPLVPRSRYRGGALVAVDPNGQELKLSLRKFHVDVHVEDGFARTTIDQTYFNHLRSRLEGTFYFPLPPDASISRLAMYVNGKLMEGGMAERQHARNTFESIKHRALDPALLEWIDGSTFKMRVFPLEGRQEKRIVLSYTQKLSRDYGRLEYRFPGGHNLESAGVWSTKIHCVDGSLLKWKCTSHDLKEKKSDGHLTLTAERKNASLERDLVLQLESTNNDLAKVDSILTSMEFEGHDYLMMRYRPSLEAKKERQRRDWVFVVDMDASRNPLLARMQIEIVRSMLKNAGDDDTFSVIAASTRIHGLADRKLKISQDSIKSAVEFLESTHLVGALDLDKAFQAALRYAKAVENPTIVHVGGGFPIVGEREVPNLIRVLDEKVPYVGVAVGKRWNRQLMRAAAKKTNGYATQINPDESASWRVTELLSALDSTRLSNIRIEAVGSAEQVHVLKSWAMQGEEVCAVVRRATKQKAITSLKLSAEMSGEPFEKTIKVENVGKGAEYLPRLWAKQAIDSMIALGAQEHRDQIIRLSKAMYVMSPFTSLLVLENDEMYTQYKVDRGRKDHWALYPCPEKIKVVHEPLQGPKVASSSDKAAKKEAYAKVLRTIIVPARPRRSSLVTRLDRYYLGFDGDQNGDSLVVPDGGSVMLGGIRVLSDGRSNGALYDVNGSVEADFGWIGQTSWYSDASRREWSERSPQVHFGSNWGLDTPVLANTQGILLADEEDRPANEPVAMIQLRGTQAEEIQVRRALTNLFGIDANPQDTLGRYRASSENLSYFLQAGQHKHYPVADFIMPTNRVGFMVTKQMVNQPVNFEVELAEVELGLSYRYQPLRVNRTREDAIVQRLEQVVQLKFNNGTLKNALQNLVKSLQIPIRFSKSVLKEKPGIEDRRVTHNLKLPLGEALHRVLSPYGLAYYVSTSGIHVCSPQEAERELMKRSYWLDESLLLFLQNQDEKKADGPKKQTAKKAGEVSKWTAEVWAARLAKRIQGSLRSGQSYTAPQTTVQNNVFGRLVRFAPGFGISRADILSVFEREVDGAAAKKGDVDDGARRLIERSRKRDWSTVLIKSVSGDFRITFDGQGRFRYDRRTILGLREIIVCDGTTVRHMYPELGIGTVRKNSRFYQAAFSNMLPWRVQSVADLSSGADVRQIGPNTVAIAPHLKPIQTSSTTKVTDKKNAKSGERKTDDAREHVRMHLVFAEDGRLKERQLVRMPTGEVIVREAYSEQGEIRWLNESSELLGSKKYELRSGTQPQLKPQTKQLVMLPMPIRTHDHVSSTITKKYEEQDKAAKGKNALKEIARQREERLRSDPTHWKEGEALELVASFFKQDVNALKNVIARRFFAKGDRRIGFYTLLVSSGLKWDIDSPVGLNDGTTAEMNPLKDHPKSRLAQFLAEQLGAEETTTKKMDENKFIQELAEFRYLCRRWSPLRLLSRDVEKRNKDLDRAFDFVESSRNPHLAYVVLRRIQRVLGDRQPHGRIAEAILNLEERGVSSYVVHYELARSIAKKNMGQAQRLFIQLFQRAIESGAPPLMDRDFIAAMKGLKDLPLGESKEKGFNGLIKATVQWLIQQRRDREAIELAWQAERLGQSGVAMECLEMIRADSTARPEITQLVLLDYLIHKKRDDRARQMVGDLLNQPTFSDSIGLRRVASELARRSGRLAEAISYLEVALDLEYKNLPAAYDVSKVRKSYQQLFGLYGKLIKVVAVPGDQAPMKLVQRVIRSADRWRSLETDVTQVCQQAYSLLRDLGYSDLAWDYLTTPVALKPNEAAPWLAMAGTLISNRDYGLADRAYESAFASEKTNAQILWDHANMLKRAGKSSKAKMILRKLAEGDWQRRFNGLKRDAKRALGE